MARNTTTRLTFGEGDRFPTWTPDGTRVAFGSPLSWKLADGTGDVEVLAADVPGDPQAFSPDGSILVFQSNDDLGMLSLDGDRSSTILLDGEYQERNASLSPDGRWIAYESNESGDFEVYVRPFPEVTTGRWQVSSGVGGWPIWNPNGRELFFKTSEHLMAMAYDDESTFTPGVATELFDLAPYLVGQGNRRIAVSPDGERFLLQKILSSQSNTEDSALPQINVVLNWFEELKERVPVP